MKTSEQVFCNLLQDKLGHYWQRALKLFRDYGDNCSFDVANVLRHAVDKHKIQEVVEILEEHYQSHLRFQHPDIRGIVGDGLLGVNPTHAMFLRICEQTLGLQPNPE